jgi:PAS domain S-box-containing protein
MQGMLLVAIFLLCESGFIGRLAWLLLQAEAEGTRQERACEISAKADRLSLIIYDRGDAIGRYARSLQFGPTDSSAASTDDVTEIITWLKKAFIDNAEAKALVEKIEKEIAICLPVINDIQKSTPTLAQPEERQAWDKKREAIQPLVNQLLIDIPALVAISSNVDNDAPEKERLKRQLTEKVLVAGLIANLMAVLLIAYLFVSRITARLDILTENTVRLKDGRQLIPRLIGNDEIAGVDAVFHETAETLRQEMKVLKAGEERIRALIENLPVGIVLLDTNGAIEFINASVESIFRYEAHQLLGKRLTKLFAPGQAIVEGAPHSQQSQAAFNQAVELTALDKDGLDLPVDFMMAEIQMAGESKILVMIMDATEKYQLKKMRQDFVFMVRSELKEPLTKVSSFLTKFGDGSLGLISPQGTATSIAMQQNIERLIVLLNDLFDLEKLESGKIEIDPTIVQLSSIFERSVNAVSMFAQKHAVQLEVASTHLELRADENRIVQVLVNLLSNAIKFSPANSLVSVAVRQSLSHVEIGVIDRGPGIPLSQADAIFEAYRQIEGDDSEKKGGTGLGLTICKSIVEAHGGQIGVTSEVGKGSVFWFKLPCTGSVES